MTMELIRDTSFALMWIGYLVTLLLFWFGVRREVNKAVKFLADRMTEQNRHVNPLLESIRDEVRKALKEVREGSVLGDPYRTAPARCDCPDCSGPDVVSAIFRDPEPTILTEWVPGTACPYCKTEHNQQDPKKPAVFPADAATPERPLLLWECSFCNSQWETPPQTPQGDHPRRKDPIELPRPYGPRLVSG